jgi:hypothetical protein
LRFFDFLPIFMRHLSLQSKFCKSVLCEIRVFRGRLSDHFPVTNAKGDPPVHMGIACGPWSVWSGCHPWRLGVGIGYTSGPSLGHSAMCSVSESIHLGGPNMFSVKKSILGVVKYSLFGPTIFPLQMLKGTPRYTWVCPVGPGPCGPGVIPCVFGSVSATHPDHRSVNSRCGRGPNPYI